MSGFVYVWRDRKHKRYYVGSHWGSPDDGYVCSSSWMKQAYLHRPQDFKRRIVAKIDTDRADLLKEEQRWLDMIKQDEMKVRYYNLTLKSGRRWYADQETRLSVGQKISKSLKGKRRRSWSSEQKQRISSSLMGHSVSEETRRKLSNRLRGRQTGPRSIETRRKISSSLMGHSVSEESKARMSLAQKRLSRAPMP